MKTIKGFKGFNSNFKCRDFQFEVGKTYTTDKAVICESGFHFCENPLDIWNYYFPSNSRYAEVKGSGKTATHTNDSKVACTHLKVGIEIGLNDIISAGVKFILDKVDWTNNKESNTGDQSAATVEGKQSIACGLGVENKAKGKKTCWLVLAEWEQNKKGDWVIKDIKSVLVDGNTVKEDIFYMLKNGKFVEVE